MKVTTKSAAGDRDLSPLDAEFASLLGRLAGPAEAETLALTGALLSRERGLGHACVRLADWAGRRLTDGSPRLPALDSWQRTLRRSALVGDGAEATPLVLDEAGRCYLYRYWLAESRVAARLASLARCYLPLEAAALAVADVQFGRSSSSILGREELAAVLTLVSRLTTISGGPGTGKTTLIARIAALHATLDPTMRIALAAPTGKAAARLAESVRAQLGSLALSEDAAAAVPREVVTLHRLLAYSPGRQRFLHNAEQPLPCDLVIVDEASMIDLLTMDALLDALRPSARLVLVGDKDQLSSVEAGFVFGDLCRATGGVSGRLARALRELGVAAADAPEAATGLLDTAIELETSHRFRDRPGLEALAHAVRDGDADRALELLAGSAFDEIALLDEAAETDRLLARFDDDLTRLVDAATPEEALQRTSALRALAVTNSGPWGTGRLVGLFETHLQESGVHVSTPFYRCRPVIVTRNDYSLNLFNGDTGICFPDADGRTRVWFATPDGLRPVSPSRLPEHATAWALTVHKSQGSEFARVMLCLPREESRLLSRELIYTAITRARDRLWIVASHEQLRRAIERGARRQSGLTDLLLGEMEPPETSPG